eukprot:TRINITY_DN122019_c0_g1_i1.p1 TRINITY_DN122019_c0_g1~~TRINITY_DN122019_c0_g1_i1.p1  ORF type:complete len:965 (+),score=181.54 TRINITY_DN122019_c0_g1_i1:178-3072(+)
MRCLACRAPRAVEQGGGSTSSHGHGQPDAAWESVLSSEPSPLLRRPRPRRKSRSKRADSNWSKSGLAAGAADRAKAALRGMGSVFACGSGFATSAAEDRSPSTSHSIQADDSSPERGRAACFQYSMALPWRKSQQRGRSLGAANKARARQQGRRACTPGRRKKSGSMEDRGRRRGIAGRPFPLVPEDEPEPEEGQGSCSGAEEMDASLQLLMVELERSRMQLEDRLSHAWAAASWQGQSRAADQFPRMTLPLSAADAVAGPAEAAKRRSRSAMPPEIVFCGSPAVAGGDATALICASPSQASATSPPPAKSAVRSDEAEEDDACPEASDVESLNSTPTFAGEAQNLPVVHIILPEEEAEPEPDIFLSTLTAGERPPASASEQSYSSEPGHGGWCFKERPGARRRALSALSFPVCSGSPWWQPLPGAPMSPCDGAVTALGGSMRRGGSRSQILEARSLLADMMMHGDERGGMVAPVSPSFATPRSGGRRRCLSAAPAPPSPRAAAVAARVEASWRWSVPGALTPELSTPMTENRSDVAQPGHDPHAHVDSPASSHSLSHRSESARDDLLSPISAIVVPDVTAAQARQRPCPLQPLNGLMPFFPAAELSSPRSSPRQQRPSILASCCSRSTEDANAKWRQNMEQFVSSRTGTPVEEEAEAASHCHRAEAKRNWERTASITSERQGSLEPLNGRMPSFPPASLGEREERCWTGSSILEGKARETADKSASARVSSPTVGAASKIHASVESSEGDDGLRKAAATHTQPVHGAATGWGCAPLCLQEESTASTDSPSGSSWAVEYTAREGSSSETPCGASSVTPLATSRPTSPGEWVMVQAASDGGDGSCKHTFSNTRSTMAPSGDSRWTASEDLSPAPSSSLEPLQLFPRECQADKEELSPRTLSAAAQFVMAACEMSSSSRCSEGDADANPKTEERLAMLRRLRQLAEPPAPQQSERSDLADGSSVVA